MKKMKPDDKIQEHIDRVPAWLDENVRAYPTSREVTLSEFEIDWNTLAGSFRVAFDGEPLPERLRFDLEISGRLHYRMPMFVSPLDAPASYPAYEFTDWRHWAIDYGLRAVHPRLHGYGIVWATGKEIGNGMPPAEPIVDHEQFEAAKTKANAPGYSAAVRVRGISKAGHISVSDRPDVPQQRSKAQSQWVAKSSHAVQESLSQKLTITLAAFRAVSLICLKH